MERAAATEPITITGEGQSQTITKAFTLDSAWVRSNLGVAVFVQATDKNVLNGRGTELTEDNALTPASLGRVKALFN